MRLILCRHGNTFKPGDKVIRAGAREDLVLVDSGVKQAHEIARYLERGELKPVKIYAGPLTRTKVTAKIIAEDLQLSQDVLVDQRLNELDYGKWSGLSDPEILDKFGEAELLAWNEKSIWPVNAGFQPAEHQVRSEVRAFVDQILAESSDNDCILAVTSNGRLRYFLDLVPGLFEDSQRKSNFKVKTGHICIFEAKSGVFQLITWNQDPIFATA